MLFAWILVLNLVDGASKIAMVNKEACVKTAIEITTSPSSPSRYGAFCIQIRTGEVLKFDNGKQKNG